MEPPKCRACGAKEWNHVCGGDVPAKVLPKAEPASSGLAKGVVVADTDSSEIHGKDSSQGDSGDAAVPQQKADTGQVARNRRWRAKNREKYNAYMRKYRRDRK